MQADEVDAEAAQAFGDLRGVGFFGKVCAEGEVDAEEANARAVGRAAEVFAADFELIAGCERTVQRAEVGCTREMILIEGEGEELLRVSRA